MTSTTYQFILLSITITWFVNILLPDSYTVTPLTFYYSISQVILNTILMILGLHFDNKTITITTFCIESSRRIVGCISSFLILKHEGTTPISLVQQHGIFGFWGLSYGHVILYFHFFVCIALLIIYSIFTFCLSIFIYRVQEQTLTIMDEYTESSMLLSDCSICYEEIEEGVTIRACGHGFHKDCIEPWLVKEFTCPLCRMYVFTLKTVSVD